MKRSRSKSRVWWAFGAIVLAIGILILGRVSSETIQKPPVQNIKVQNIDLNPTDTAEVEVNER